VKTKQDQNPLNWSDSRQKCQSNSLYVCSAY